MLASPRAGTSRLPASFLPPCLFSAPWDAELPWQWQRAEDCGVPAAHPAPTRPALPISPCGDAQRGPHSLLGLVPPAPCLGGNQASLGDTLKQGSGSVNPISKGTRGISDVLGSVGSPFLCRAELWGVPVREHPSKRAGSCLGRGSRALPPTDHPSVFLRFPGSDGGRRGRPGGAEEPLGEGRGCLGSGGLCRARRLQPPQQRR